MSKLILVRGIPGSGKSTMAFKMSHPIFTRYLEADMYFLDSSGNYNFNATKLGKAHKWCQEETDKLLGEGLEVIVSNTFTTKKELKPYFNIAKKYNIIPNVILCQNSFASVHNVPQETMEKMMDRFEYYIGDLFEDLLIENC